MIKLVYVTKPEEIKRILAKDDIYKNIIGIKAIENGFILPKEWGIVATFEDDTLVGVVVLQPMPNNLVCLHAGVYEEFRHIKTVQYLKKVTKKLKRVLFPLHIITMHPETSKSVSKICELAGYKYKKTISLQQQKYVVYSE